jgi:hypothetical protein
MPKLKCEGWWEQDGFGRQPMSGLVIDFSEGQLTGSGEDIVGAFVIRGSIQDNQVLIRKQYLGKHFIDYRGTADGEGLYTGDWYAGGVSGGKWSIRFRSFVDNDAVKIIEIGD